MMTSLLGRHGKGKGVTVPHSGFFRVDVRVLAYQSYIPGWVTTGPYRVIILFRRVGIGIEVLIPLEYTIQTNVDMIKTCLMMW